MTEEEIKARLQYLKKCIIDENISYGEIAELQSLAKYIDKQDTLLLEWAGVPEFPEDKELTVDEITEIFFDMLAEDKPFEEIQKATGIKKVVEDESQTIITIYYPNGEIISHWV